jgi:hypothetical protein
MKTFAVTPRAAAAIRTVCIERGLVPTVTWEQISEGQGQWILGFYAVDRLSDQALICDTCEVSGVSFIVDGPKSKRDELAASILDIDGGGYSFRLE